jgi:hypothetical protein
MDIGALLLAVIALVTAVLDQRKRTAPARERAQQDEAVDADLNGMDAAIADLDAASIGTRFERERRETLKRTAADPGRVSVDSRLP